MDGWMMGQMDGKLHDVLYYMYYIHSLKSLSNKERPKKDYSFQNTNILTPCSFGIDLKVEYSA
jgi:hypothetical protein